MEKDNSDIINIPIVQIDNIENNTEDVPLETLPSNRL